MPLTFPAALIILFAPAARCAVLTRGPYVVDASSVSAEVCWRLDSKDACQVFAGLSPGSTFSYSTPASTMSWTARTLPAPGASLSFAVFGDSGEEGEPLMKVAAALERADPELVLHLGDIIYPTATDEDYGPKYFKPYAASLARVPFFTTPGNHDYGNSLSGARNERRFQEVYSRIHRRPKYYSFDAGPAHFVSLDTNVAAPVAGASPIGPGSAQRRWLEEDLAGSKARWRFVFMHVPLYSTFRHHGDNAALRESLEPLFRKYGVDVVFQGHEHLYERSRPVGGVVYVTAGTGGAQLHMGDSYPDWLEKRLMEYGLAIARVDDKSLSVEFRDSDGTVKDSFTIEKAAASPEAPEQVTFKTEDGWTIVGIFHPPMAKGRVAVLVHGVAAGKAEWDPLVAELRKLGLGTLAIDLRGHGESTQGPQGPADFRTFDAAQEWPKAEGDVAAALAFLKGRGIRESRVSLIGASIGANIISRIAAKAKGVPWVVLLSPGFAYRGVPVGDLSGRRVLLAASPADIYAYETSQALQARWTTAGAKTRSPVFLPAKRGHGAQMFEDADFLKKMLGWIGQEARR